MVVTAESVIEFANEVWFDGVQYGFLTDKCRRRYVIGQFTRPLLVCDTLLTIEDRQWAVLHHMMYTPLKLTGIPQAWVVLNDKEGQYFEKVETSAAFKAELEAYVTSSACCVCCDLRVKLW